MQNGTNINVNINKEGDEEQRSPITLCTTDSNAMLALLKKTPSVRRAGRTVCNATCQHEKGAGHGMAQSTQADPKIEEIRKHLLLVAETQHSGGCAHHAHHHPTEGDATKTVDGWMKLGVFGEWSAASMGMLVWAPGFEYLIPNNGQFLLKRIYALKLSPLALILAALIVPPSMMGSGHCHLKLEEMPRLRKELLDSIVSGNTVQWPIVQVDHENVTLDPKLFSFILPSKAPAFTVRDYLHITGDVLGHFVEYVGLWLLLIALQIENRNTQLALSCLSTLIAAITSIPEAITCINTLKDINAFKNYQLIRHAEEGNSYYKRLYPYLMVFSAIGKGIPAFLATGLNFQQIFWGSATAGFAFAFFVTLAYVYVQYVINANTAMPGIAHRAHAECEHDDTPIVFNSFEQALIDRDWCERTTLVNWKKTSRLDKSMLIGTAIATGSERAEPYLFVTFLLHSFSKSLESGISASLLFLGVLTSISYVRNASTHLNVYRKNQNDAFSCIAQLPCFRSKKQNQNGLRESLISRNDDEIRESSIALSQVGSMGSKA